MNSDGKLRLVHAVFLVQPSDGHPRRHRTHGIQYLCPAQAAHGRAQHGEGNEKARPWHPLYNIILFSLFGWVLARHPWSLSFHGFHIDYQPWISLIYLAIFLGPLVGYALI